jgi:hypothetical protein
MTKTVVKMTTTRIIPDKYFTQPDPDPCEVPDLNGLKQSPKTGTKVAIKNTSFRIRNQQIKFSGLNYRLKQ